MGGFATHELVLFAWVVTLREAWTCYRPAYVPQFNEYRASEESNMKATGRSMPMILARTQWAPQCPKESNFQFSTFNIFERRTKQIKKEGTQSNPRTVFVCDLPVS